MWVLVSGLVPERVEPVMEQRWGESEGERYWILGTIKQKSSTSGKMPPNGHSITQSTDLLATGTASANALSHAIRVPSAAQQPSNCPGLRASVLSLLVEGLAGVEWS